MFATLVLSSRLATQPARAEGEAATFYVAPGAVCGGVSPCYGTIQEAVDAAQAGDTVKVAKGTYTGAGFAVVRFTRSLALLGGFATTNWSTSDPLTNPTIIDGQNQVGRRGIVAEGTVPNFITAEIAGFYVTNGNNSPPQGCGGICAVTTLVDIHDNTVISNTGSGIQVANSIGTVRRNLTAYNRPDLLNLGGTGIVAESSLLTVDSNTSRFNDGGGLASIISTRLLATNNSLTDNQGAGIVSNHGLSFTASNNIVQGTTGRGIWVRDPSAVQNTIVLNIANNTIVSNTTQGILMDASAIYTGSVVNNTIADNRSSGILAQTDQGSQIVISGNSVLRNRFRGIWADASKGTQVIVLNNTINDNLGGGLVAEMGEVTRATIDGNTFRRNVPLNISDVDGGGGMRVQGRGTVQVSHNLVVNNLAYGFGGGIYLSSTVNPANGAQGNYTLNANRVLTNTSNGLGAGIAIGGGIITATNDIIARNFTELPAVYVFGGNLKASHWTLAYNGSFGMRVFFGGVASVTNVIAAGHKVAAMEQSTGGSLKVDHLLSWENGKPCDSSAECTNVIEADPKFFSPRAIDYHITAGSAAIDQGIATGVTDDVDGPGRPQGSAPDLGADELGNFTPTVNEVFLPLTLR
jgi:hypothetical protein